MINVVAVQGPAEKGNSISSLERVNTYIIMTLTIEESLCLLILYR